MSQKAEGRRLFLPWPRKQLNLTAQGARCLVQVLEVLQEADNVVACFAGHTHKVTDKSSSLSTERRFALWHNSTF